MKIYLIKKLELEVKNTNLLNSVFDTDRMEIQNLNKIYIFILMLIIVILIILIFFAKKNIYYENYIITENENIIMIVEKSKINMINDNGDIIIDDIKNNYNIIKIKTDDDNCFVYIDLKKKIENINHQKYQVLLGKETIIEYIIKVLLG